MSEVKMSRAEVLKIVEDIWGPIPKSKPRLVASDAEIVRDANVQVSPSDPNYSASADGVVKVRRSDFVTVNMQAYEEQQRWKREDRLRRRSLDPSRLGH